tara:strand:- start:269 stop:385 length:117 start_codon:yes stop_codon:yes gene_type:complete
LDLIQNKNQNQNRLDLKIKITPHLYGVGFFYAKVKIKN